MCLSHVRKLGRKGLRLGFARAHVSGYGSGLKLLQVAWRVQLWVPGFFALGRNDSFGVDGFRILVQGRLVFSRLHWLPPQKCKKSRAARFQTTCTQPPYPPSSPLGRAIPQQNSFERPLPSQVRRINPGGSSHTQFGAGCELQGLASFMASPNPRFRAPTSTYWSHILNIAIVSCQIYLNMILVMVLLWFPEHA